MNDNHVRLQRVHRVGHSYEAQVRVRNGGGEPFTLTVRDVPLWSNKTNREWVVETDTARWFKSFKRAREYIDTFFEEAK